MLSSSLIRSSTSGAISSAGLRGRPRPPTAPGRAAAPASPGCPCGPDTTPNSTRWPGFELGDALGQRVTVDEDVVAVVVGEEAEALLRVEQLHLAGRHRDSCRSGRRTTRRHRSTRCLHRQATARRPGLTTRLRPSNRRRCAGGNCLRSSAHGTLDSPDTDDGAPGLEQGASMAGTERVPQRRAERLPERRREPFEPSASVRRFRGQRARRGRGRRTVALRPGDAVPAAGDQAALPAPGPADRPNLADGR